jgi:hypothetical protein
MVYYTMGGNRLAGNAREKMPLHDRTVRTDPEVEAAVAWLLQVGLAGPAYLLLQAVRPISFVGGQGLLFLQPLLPFGSWRRAVGGFAELLSDRSRLDTLLSSLETRLRGPKRAQDGENSG